MRSRCKYFRKNISLSKEELIEKATDTLQPHVVQFVKCQINAAAKALHGRRFTRILGMMYKESAKTYKLLQNFFSLP